MVTTKRETNLKAESLNCHQRSTIRSTKCYIRLYIVLAARSAIFRQRQSSPVTHAQRSTAYISVYIYQHYHIYIEQILFRRVIRAHTDKHILEGKVFRRSNHSSELLRKHGKRSSASIVELMPEGTIDSGSLLAMRKVSLLGHT